MLKNPLLHTQPRISIITPTFRRPHEVDGLLANLCGQIVLPIELILIDGTPDDDQETQKVVHQLKEILPFKLTYIRRGGGTAIQRNVGIDQAEGDFIAFLDDDIRLEEDFFAAIIAVFEKDVGMEVGGVVGYIINQYLDPNTSPRWRWYKRLKLFTTYEPGRYDFETGYPINRYLQAPHNSLKSLDFMGSGCTVWRKQVFGNGLRFADYFRDYGVLEDAHLALRAGRDWKLLECGSARCTHLKSPGGRDNHRLVAQRTATNYRYVFIDIVPERTICQEFRFWRVQFIDLLRFFLAAIRTPKKSSWLVVLGKIEGILIALRMWDVGKVA